MGKDTYKSFSELQQAICQKEVDEKREREYLNNKLTLTGSICDKINRLEEANNDILLGKFTYSGKSQVIKEFYLDDGIQLESIQIGSIIEKIKAYINIDKPDLNSLKNIVLILDRFIKSSNKLDEKIEAKKLEREKKIKDETESQAENSLDIIIKKRKIEHLYHFTRIENLDSILFEGLLPRCDLKKSRRKFIYNDEDRHDGFYNCSCLSIEFPNTRVLRSKIEKEPNSNWIILAYSADLLYEQRNYYAEHNAATKSVNQGLMYKTTPECFEMMFSDSINITYANGFTRMCSRENLPLYFPTSDQAEILVEGVIHPRFIQAINFQSERYAKQYESLLNDRDIGCFVNIDWFKCNRSDFSWKER